MNPAILAFASSEKGAITVDWVIISAGVVGMALAVIALVGGGANNSGLQTAGVLSEYELDTEFETDGGNN
jgi:hypothetical protein